MTRAHAWLPERGLLTLCLLCLAGGPAPLVAQERPAPDTFDIVFIQDSGPVLLRIRPCIGARSVQSLFQAHLKKWFDFLDTNHDGKLDANELIGAPKAGTMAQLVRFGNFGAGQQPTLTLADLKKKTGETATFGDFVHYYQRFNVQAFQIMPTYRGDQYADRAGEALFKLLDVDKDGKLTRAEIAAAPQLLSKYDLDDDEMVSVQELLPADNLAMKRRPAAMALAMQRPEKSAPARSSFAMSFYPLIKAGERERLPAILLSLFDKDDNGKLSPKECGFDAATFAALDKNKDGELDDEELAQWADGPADFELVLQIPSGRAQPRKQVPDEETTLALKSASPRFLKKHTQASLLSSLVSMGDVEITVQARAPAEPADPGSVYAQQFMMADPNENGYVELADLEAPQFQSLKNAFALLDRDRDGKVTEEELANVTALLAEAPRYQVTLAVIEHGQAFFQLLDTNRDGRLSAYELQTAWSRLEPRDVGKKGYITYEQVPRQFQIVVLPGSTQDLLRLNAPALQGNGQQLARAPLPGNVPEWFRKMDTNGDGFISPREFLGSRADFRRIDANGDGLIDPEEAIRFDLLTRSN